MSRLCATLVAAAATLLIFTRPRAADDAKAFSKIDEIFADYALDNHIPGVVYGVVADGKLVYVRGIGVQDLEARRPVTADTLFRIASMTKAFTALTILKLRDEGKLQLDAPAENYVEEMRSWKYPTQDSPRIRVRDLLNHTAGFVTDDPWGDRQTPLSEAEFTRLLREGVPFTRPPATALGIFESGLCPARPDHHQGVRSTVRRHDHADVCRSRWAWIPRDSSSKPVHASDARSVTAGKMTPGAGADMAHGAFGAMGGIQTSANDYAKWVAYLLSAWPPRDEANSGPVSRATVRELAQGASFPRAFRSESVVPDKAPAALASSYGMGFHRVHGL